MNASAQVSIYSAIEEIFNAIEQGGVVRIRAIGKKREEITAYLLAHISGVRIDRFYTCHFSSMEWNSLLTAKKKIDEMDIKFIEPAEMVPNEKAIRIVTI